VRRVVRCCPRLPRRACEPPAFRCGYITLPPHSHARGRPGAARSFALRPPPPLIDRPAARLAPPVAAVRPHVPAARLSREQCCWFLRTASLQPTGAGPAASFILGGVRKHGSSGLHLSMEGTSRRVHHRYLLEWKRRRHRVEKRVRHRPRPTSTHVRLRLGGLSLLPRYWIPRNLVGHVGFACPSGHHRFTVPGVLRLRLSARPTNRGVRAQGHACMHMHVISPYRRSPSSPSDEQSRRLPPAVLALRSGRSIPLHLQ
jgi:hypothetical protein